MTSSSTFSSHDKSLLEALSQSEIFKSLPLEALSDVVGLMHKQVVPKGTVVFEEGSPADAIYLILKGSLKIDCNEKNKEHFLAVAASGGVIGEIEVLTGEDRCATAIAEKKTTLAVLDRSDFEGLLKKHPHLLDWVAKGVLERLRRKHLLKILPNFLGALPYEEILEIEKHTRWVHLPGRELLIDQGSYYTHLNLVVSGHLRAIRTESQGNRKVIAEIGVGELVGETIFFMKRKAPHAIYATRDTDLLQFTQEGIDYLTEHYPHAMIPICRTLIDRFEKVLRKETHGEIMHHIAVIPASPDVDITQFTEWLVKAMNRISPTLLLSSDSVDSYLNRPGASQLSYGDADYIRYAAWRDEHQDEYDYTVYQADAKLDNWSRRCARQADHIIVVGDAEGDPTPQELENELIEHNDNILHVRESLVLLHQPGTRSISGTAAWLKGRKIDRHYHVRMGDESHIERVARFLMGKAIGLVFGGGGARGFAHIGALKAIDEAGLPIDHVGGTSIGSYIAGCYAANKDREETQEALRKLVDAKFDYTAPIIALLAGKNCNDILRDTCKDIDISDLWTPFFCLSTNLTTADIEIHTSGSLWRSIRASISIPGLLPPVIKDGHVLVDGGLLSLVPISTMQDLLHAGSVIAVDVGEHVEGKQYEAYEDQVSGWGLLLKRLNPFFKTPKIPGLGSILYRVSEMGTFHPHFRLLNRERADLYIEPAVKDLRLLGSEDAETCIRLGYEATQKALEEWEELPKLQSLFCPKHSS